MAIAFQVALDCADPDLVARFWAEALHYKMQDPPNGFGSWEAFLRHLGVPEERWHSASAVVDPDGSGPRMFFQQVPEGKTVKNRVHLDLNVSGGPGVPMDIRVERVEAEAKRLVDAGATRLRVLHDPVMDHYGLVMSDPEGNEFCVH